MSVYPLAIALTIVANVGYHLCQKGVRPDTSPAATLVGTYAVALVLSLLLWPWLGGGEGITSAMRRLGPTSYALGACVVLIELGFLLAYRSGWDIGVAALYSNAATALVLLPVGLWAFAEGIDGRKAAGLAFAMVGLLLLSSSPKTDDPPEPTATSEPSS